VWPYAGYVAVGKLYAASELCSSGQAWGVWVSLASGMVLAQMSQWRCWHETEPQNQPRNRSHVKDGFSKFKTPLIIIAGITGTREVESQ
jgi:hypothetical protein